MTFIFGGAYQGKLTYAIEKYNLTEKDIWNCTLGMPDFSHKAIYKLEEVLLSKLKKGEDPVAYLERHLDALNDKIVIITDLSGGTVPADPLMRRWRDSVSSCSALLARNAQTVIKIYCGVGTVLK